MDGREVQRLRLAEKSAAQLQMQNTYLSAQVLQQQGVIDRVMKQSAIDRLLTAALIQRFSSAVPASPDGEAEAVVELRIADVDVIRGQMTEPPGMGVHLVKDVERGVWVAALKRNPMDVPIIRECSACGRDHINPPSRAPNDQEKEHHVTVVLQCPEKGADVAMVVKRPDGTPEPQPEKPKIQVVRR